jgi:hypothetical protein
MRAMQFLPELKRFLLKYGSIYTVRKYDMDEREVLVDGVGVCQRRPLGRISCIEDLIPYHHFSGFGSLEDWWAKVKYFIPQGNPMFLYLVIKKAEVKL